MTFSATVKGGTGAGRKKPLKPSRTSPWACADCGRVNQPFVVVCLTYGCRQNRPKE